MTRKQTSRDAHTEPPQRSPPAGSQVEFSAPLRARRQLEFRRELGTKKGLTFWRELGPKKNGRTDKGRHRPDEFRQLFSHVPSFESVPTAPKKPPRY